MSLDSSIDKANHFDAIIQARMGSTRLSGKVLADLGGKPIIQHVVERVGLTNPDNLILAIPDTPQDIQLAKWAEANNVDFTRGSEDDVLSRFILAAKKCTSDILIRVTADNPFCEMEIVTKTVQALIMESADYSVMEGSPIGTTVEAFTRDTLYKLDSLANTPEEREHVTLAIWNHPDEFKIHLIDAPDYLRYNGLRLTIDTEKDLMLARHLFRALAGDLRTIKLRDIIKYVKCNPLVMRINGGVSQHLESFLSKRKSELRKTHLKELQRL